ncbi:hypothetical protein [Streptococcus loxodontisalivarius]|uniref:Uncharacterized protein n=1 Tax=Streptococcus loxodontisalivarius TaxID=1349415 RepID=A0ABS2PV55_9STRE|nr:hypothetical protein [Streptococcus loxodontisalivarius]MBM7643339.1 hypothetical protein [Streptococcus loxodontisalivarius]
MENIISSWSKLKKITEEYTKLPIIYILFVFLNLLVYLDKGTEISRFLTTNLVLKKLIGLLLEILSIVYDNILVIYTVLFIVILVILLLFEKTPIFNSLPEDIEYISGYIESWNPVSAAKRLFSLIVNLSTNLFVVYIFTIFIIKPDKFFIENNFVVIKEITEETVINFLWYLNYIFLIYMVLRSLFVIKYKGDNSYLKLDSFRYNEISSFNVSNEWETNCIMIVKDTYNFKQYYLLEGQTHRQVWKERSISHFGVSKEQEFYWQKEAIPISKRSYKILDKSENLSDIVYYYKELKKRRTHD